jgi:hypothetical protein
LYTVSLDLGQSRDYSALSVIEQSVFFSAAMLEENPWPGIDVGWNSPAGMTERRLKAAFNQPGDSWPEKPPLAVRHLHRYPLGTSYPSIVCDVAGLMRTLSGGAVSASLVIDLTGTGRPVFDMFREAGLRPIGISIHGGGSTTRDSHGWRVPKRDLVSVVSTGLQTRRLQIAAELPLAGVLVKELLAFKVTINPQTSHDSYSAWRESDHDDLVLSVAMGCWYRDRVWRQVDRQRIRPAAAHVG